jgi:hypothetical protein
LTALFQCGADDTKLSSQPGANAVDDSDDHNSDTGGDQAILDGGRTRFIGEESANCFDGSSMSRKA